MNLMHHTVPAELKNVRAQNGRSLGSLSQLSPLMLVFLRNLDCPFCKRTLSDLAAQRAVIEEDGVQIAIVHMASDYDAQSVFTEYGLDDLPRFSDPERKLYLGFNLRRCAISEAYGLPIKLQAVALRDELEDVSLMGDPLQMPGVVLIDQGRMVACYTYGSVSDRPDFREIVWKVLAAAV